MFMQDHSVCWVESRPTVAAGRPARSHLLPSVQMTMTMGAWAWRAWETLGCTVVFGLCEGVVPTGQTSQGGVQRSGLEVQTAQSPACG